MTTNTNLKGQDLKEHQWGNRIVLIIADAENNTDFQKQLTDLQVAEEGLKERDIIIYKILPQQWQKGLSMTENWEESNQFYVKYKQLEGALEVQLIGLDGTVKLVQNNTLSPDKLFATIDKMPMRRAKMRRKGQN